MTLQEFLLERTAKNGFEDVPFLSHIEGNLYSGMSPVYWPCPAQTEFAYIFDFYSGCLPEDDEDRYPLYDDQINYKTLVCYDGPRVPEKSLIDGIAKEIVSAQQKGMTLVHCQMGINRSSLFLAAALCHMGRTADEAIELLRRKRHPMVLQNRAFELFLRANYS